MDDQTAQVIGAIIILAILIGLIKGGIKTFQRNWIAALLLLLLLTPIWMIWAIVEIFTAEITKSANQPTSNSQNVNVTLVTQADGTLRKADTSQSDDETKIIDGQVANDESGEVSPNQTQLTDSTRVCPYCAETIKQSAIICRYCKSDVGAN